MKRIEEIRAHYATTPEALGLESRDTNSLIEMHNADSNWCRHPCGDIEIDGGILARSMLVGDILSARRVPFAMGKYQGPVLP